MPPGSARYFSCIVPERKKKAVSDNQDLFYIDVYLEAYSDLHYAKHDNVILIPHPPLLAEHHRLAKNSSPPGTSGSFSLKKFTENRRHCSYAVSNPSRPP